MTALLTPLRWPIAWKDPSALALLKRTPVNCVLMEKSAGLEAVRAEAEKSGFKVVESSSPPENVSIVQGLWPGVKLSRAGGGNRASMGPTGVPWVDSNGWKVRLNATLHPGNAVWVEAAPQDPRLSAESYVASVADAAVKGGRWIISLDERLAAGIAARQPEALETWKRVVGATRFFEAHPSWSAYRPEAILSIVSDFSGRNQFLSNEVVNLVDRSNQQYWIIPKNKVSADSFKGLRAILYPDVDPPAADVWQQMLSFVQAGGLLIAGPKWGEVPGASIKSEEHPRFTLYSLGKGTLALSRANFSDPYLLASDSAVLISHRYELLRFWNGGAVRSYYTSTSNRKRALVQMIFYATRGADNTTVRIAGRYRTAKLWTLDQSEARAVPMELQRDALEVHLPRVAQYAAIELEA